MSSDQEEASHVVVVNEGSHRIGESPFCEAEKPTMGSLQLIRRGRAPQTQKLDQCGGWVRDHLPEF